ncbi:MAG TPA: hypothetical protein VN249_00255 [Prolixibacteraceae bacterium]|nr:hypothetical protein [Prolixibacteraceae bacterium]
MNWKNCPPIPPRKGMEKQFGLAGPLSGAHGNLLLVAGGANFEKGMPWRGGVKTYHDEIFLLEEMPDGTLTWKDTDYQLPFPVAYSSCVTLKDGFVSIGGENERGLLSSVIHFSFAGGYVEMNNLPELPEKVSCSGAALVNRTIIVVGGITGGGESPGCYSLSAEKLQSGWTRLADLPVPLSHVVVVSQFDGHEQAVFVLGGRNKTAEVSEFFSTVWKYSPSSNQWSRAKDIILDGKPVQLAAGTGFARGKDEIILLGGDRGLFFNQTERMNLEIGSQADSMLRTGLLKKKDLFLSNHPGFSRQILSYHTLSGECEIIGEIPGESPVTTVLYPWKHKIVVPSGEIRPGVRTDKVMMLEME